MNEYRFEDIKLGLTESFTVEVNETMLQSFLDITGDNNPLHTDKDYAISRGFRDRVVYGMLTSSFFSTLAGVHLPGRYCLLQEVDASFHAPVYTGDTLVIAGEVIYINDTVRQVEIAASVKNQANKRVAKAKIKVGFLDE